MKLISALAATAAIVILTGCDDPVPALLSLNPVAATQEVTFDPALIGSWQDTGDSTNKAVCVIRRGENNGYLIQYTDGTTQMAFTAQQFRVGDASFLDLVAQSDNDFLISGHAMARVWVTGSVFRWALLDSDWFKEQAAQLAATHPTDKKVVLLAPGPAVRELVGKVGLDDRAHSAIVEWEKVQ